MGIFSFDIPDPVDLFNLNIRCLLHITDTVPPSQSLQPHENTFVELS